MGLDQSPDLNPVDSEFVAKCESRSKSRSESGSASRSGSESRSRKRLRSVRIQRSGPDRRRHRHSLITLLRSTTGNKAINVKVRLVQKIGLEWKQTDGRTNTTDRITFFANAGGQYVGNGALQIRPVTNYDGRTGNCVTSFDGRPDILSARCMMSIFQVSYISRTADALLLQRKRRALRPESGSGSETA